ncbi:MAG: alpha/beta hydrolase fold protein [Rhodospirillales bacterium]|nr:alpha/beta hydrolase fold protein [Rhodospirillales bacterium]MCE3257392.1 alpha/beta hydrolase fold protein [Nitrobacter vulgaris]
MSNRRKLADEIFVSTDTLITEPWNVGAGSQLDVTRAGQGRPIMFLHPGIGLRGASPFVKALGRIGRVIAPAHPGFQGSPSADYGSVDDLSYLYLSLLESLDEPALVIGSSLGAWIALEVAVKSVANIAGLVLVDAVGVRFNSRDVPDFADIYALPRAELDKRMYHDPKVAQIDYANTPEPELGIIARNREAEVRLSWTPYLHNPRLRSRLHRANVPTLVVWGESDSLVPLDYGQKLAKALPDASFETIAKAGHFPHIEQPNELVSCIERFASVQRDKSTSESKLEGAR